MCRPMQSGGYFPEFASLLEIRVPSAAGSCMAIKTAGGFTWETTALSYAIDDGRRTVDVTRIAHRKDAYD